LPQFLKSVKNVLKYNFLLIFLIATSCLTISCENKTDLPKFEFLTLPSVTVKNFQTVFDDSGKVQLILTAPLMEKYDNKDAPYTEFREGIKAVFWDGKDVPSGSVTSKYAKYTDSDNTWELKDSVVVIDANKVKLETELLNWNQQKDQIYTDRFVKITDGDQVMQGFGFESDSHLQHRRIKQVSATMYIKDEE
jgi:LPS export ABC transporter protein LptC